MATTLTAVRLRRGAGRCSATSATRAATCSATACCARSRGTTPTSSSCRGPGQLTATRAAQHPWRNVVLRSVDGEPRRSTRRHRPRRARRARGRPAAAVQRRADRPRRRRAHRRGAAAGGPALRGGRARPSPPWRPAAGTTSPAWSSTWSRAPGWWGTAGSSAPCRTRPTSSTPPRCTAPTARCARLTGHDTRPEPDVFARRFDSLVLRRNMRHNGPTTYNCVTRHLRSTTRPLGKAYLDAGDEGGHGDRTHCHPRLATRGVLYVHSAPSALCPHIEWAVGGVLGMPVSLDWTRSRPRRAPTAPSSPGPATAGTAAAVASALRGWNHLRFEITEEPTAGHRGRPLLLHPRARRLPRRDRPARRHHDPRGPAQGRRGQGRARRHHAAASRSTSCSASRGTTSWRRSGTPATAPRCAGCTRSSRPDRRRLSARPIGLRDGAGGSARGPARRGAPSAPRGSGWCTR